MQSDADDNASGSEAIVDLVAVRCAVGEEEQEASCGFNGALNWLTTRPPRSIRAFPLQTVEDVQASLPQP
jgi:hypothetical protein